MAFVEAASEAEAQAAVWWVSALSPSGSATTATSLGSALRFAELASSMADGPWAPGVTKSLAWTAGAALLRHVEQIDERLGQGKCASPGSPEWFDGLAIKRATARLRVAFASVGDRAREVVYLHLLARTATRILGDYPHLVGAALLDVARFSYEHGTPEKAAAYCSAVIADFTRLFLENEEATEVAREEDCLALEQLVAAIDLQAVVTNEPERNRALRERAVGVLAAVAKPGPMR
jgi:hypothetical protein